MLKKTAAAVLEEPIIKTSGRIRKTRLFGDEDPGIKLEVAQKQSSIDEKKPSPKPRTRKKKVPTPPAAAETIEVVKFAVDPVIEKKPSPKNKSRKKKMPTPPISEAKAAYDKLPSLVAEEKAINSPKQLANSAHSSITIAIVAHGIDLPDEPFSDPSVRMVSLAGRSGTIYSGSPDDYHKIKSLFAEKHDAYATSLNKQGKRKYLAQLYSRFPNANRCEKIPNFELVGTEEVRPYSTFQFLQDNLAKGPVADSYRDKLFILDHPQSRVRPNKLMMEDAASRLTNRLHTPVINKEYLLKDDLLRHYPFGIHVMDICNATTTIKVDDNLITSTRRVNRPLIDRLSYNLNVIDLKFLVRHLHNIGFHTINIIDFSCRECMPAPDAKLKRIKTTLNEFLATKQVDKELG